MSIETFTLLFDEVLHHRRRGPGRRKGLAAGPGTQYRHTRTDTRGTDNGAGQFGHPPTGKPISIDVIDIARFAGRRMIEHWGVPDRMSVRQQLAHHA